MLVENDKLSIWFLFHDQPILRGEPSLPESDLLLSGRLLAVPQNNRLLRHLLIDFFLACGMIYMIYG